MRYHNVIGFLAFCLVHKTFAENASSTPEVSTGLSGLSTNPDDVKFYIFKDPTNMDKYAEIEYGIVSSIESSGYNKDTDCVIFFSHGFLGTAFKPAFRRNVIKAYLRKSSCGNYIAVDWSKLGTPTLDDPVFYPISAANTAIVGKRIGEMIRFLKHNRAISSPSKVHLVGHSLGAHVSGRAGQYIRKHSLTRIGRISGLDPAGPGFQYLPADLRLTHDDASFVDTIHTSLTLGYIGNVGHVSFYPNGGGPFQPNCDNYFDPADLIGVCSHSKAMEYFAYSILNSTIKACQCTDVWYKCKPDCTLTAIFGEYTKPTVRGSYHLSLATTDEDLD